MVGWVEIAVRCELSHQWTSSGEWFVGGWCKGAESTWNFRWPSLFHLCWFTCIFWVREEEGSASAPFFLFLFLSSFRSHSCSSYQTLQPSYNNKYHWISTMNPPSASSSSPGIIDLPKDKLDVIAQVYFFLSLA